MTQPQLFLLGGWRAVTADDEPLTLRGLKARALLAYLAVEVHQAHSRDSLLGLLWPELPLSNARNNLRVTLNRLRKQLAGGEGAPSPLRSDRHEVWIHGDDGLWLDVSAFQALLEACAAHDHSDLNACPDCRQRMTQAAELYQGDFMAGFHLADCLVFDEWMAVQRERLRIQAMDLFDRLTRAFEQVGEYRTAAGYARRQIELDTFHEEAYRQLMRLLCYQGRRTAALAVYQSCARVLEEELGVEPDPDTVMLHQQIRAGEVDGPPTPIDATAKPGPPRPNAHAAWRHNLPESLTPFYGREQELAQLRQRLETGTSRLITLVGPGGMGKTRLAMEAARQNRHLFDHGVYFVALAGRNRPQELPAALAEAMGVTFVEGDATPREQLLTMLQKRRMLLILDNLEHLLAPSAPGGADGDAVIDLILAILQQSPGVAILVTSRERLNAQAEDLFRLRGLAGPTPDQLEQAGQYPAVRLFCERAHRRSKNFKLTSGNVASVARICELTEGMPLGIELATTWIHDLGAEGVAATLERDLSLLATNARDAPPQHRSMEAVFASSWRLLSPEEQRVLARLAIFRGGVGSRAAMQVAGASPLILTQLRYKSLLRGAGPGRYNMHPLLRQFAAAKLADSGEATAISLRHSHFFLGWLSEYEAALAGDAPQRAVDALQPDFDNIREAWRVAVAQGQLAALAAGLSALAAYYSLSGAFAEAGVVFGDALRVIERRGADQEEDEEALARLRLHLLTELAHVHVRLARFDDAIQEAEEVTTLARTLNDRRAEARGRLLAGYALAQREETIQAIQALREAVALARDGDLRDVEGMGLRHLGNALINAGDRDAGESALHEALQIHRALDNRSEEQAVLLYLGVSKIEQGNYMAGERYLSQTLRLIEATGNRPLEARIVNAIGFVHAALGDLEVALDYHERSRQISRETHDPIQESHALHNLCTVNRKLGRLERAETHGRQALALGQDHHLADPENYAWLHLGYVWLEQGAHPLAANAFKQSRDGWRAIGRVPLAVEAEAGLAAVALATGDVDQARRRAASVFEFQEAHGLHGVDEPMQIALACYRALDAVDDPRSREILKRAHDELMAKAALITDAASYRRFLTRVPANRQIVEAWEEVAD